MKVRLRAKFKSLREQLLPHERESIKQNVYKTIKEQNIYNSREGYIGIYWPLPNEIDLRSILEITSRTPVFPADNVISALLIN